METLARNQIRLILDDLTLNSVKAFGDRVAAIYNSHAAKGLLKSGATVRIALSALEDISDKMLSTAIDQVAPIAKDVEAFAMISESFESYWSKVARSMDGVASKASGRPPNITKPDSVLLATRREVEAIRARLTRRLEIHRFTFTQPSTRLSSPPAISEPEVAVGRRKGGRPPAEFWDDMWAAIATALYSGALIPKSQADVQRAMSEWIDDNSYSAADSTVKGRARRLWDLIEALDE
ncbi:hypothetical protein [Sphingomonas sp.]|uniref:hypothetical protein n=1 Tax=Sphingomonas sp. TaxID=28214 RepID=UPI0025EBF2B2|nr:hypothetical protein [Sphingomonas sp.]